MGDFPACLFYYEEKTKGGFIQMEQEYRHAIALMRYSAIAPLIPGLPEGYKNLTDYLNEASRKGFVHPDGEVKN